MRGRGNVKEEVKKRGGIIVWKTETASSGVAFVGRRTGSGGQCLMER